MKLRSLLVLLFGIAISLNSYSQDYWKTYRKAQGLVDSFIVDIALGNDVVYLATQSGLVVFEDDSFTHYDTLNSAINNQNIKQLALYEDTVWMVTDSGLSQFHNGTITNYTVADGLVNDTIQDLVVTSDGELWIGTFRGISRKRGNTFINDPTRKVYAFGVNGGDSIYAVVNYGSVFSHPSFTTTEVYDGNTWAKVDDPTQAFPLQVNKLVTLSNGRLVLISEAQGAYLIRGTFILEKIDYSTENVANSLLNDMVLTSNGYWLAFGNPNYTIVNPLGTSGLLNHRDTTDHYHFNGLPSPNILTIASDDNKLYIGTKDGFAVADKEIDVFPLSATISNSTLAADFASNGLLFHSSWNSIDIESGDLEYTWSKGKLLIWTASLWLYGVDQRNVEKLAVQEYNLGDFGLGSISDNSTPFRPNLIKITNQEIRDHLQNYKDPNYVMPNSILNWPANGFVERGEAADQAPFIDVNNNSCYDPENGDYPFMLGDEAVYIIINDDVNPETGLFTDNLGIELHIMAYVFDEPQLPHVDQSVYVRYTVVNRSRHTYQFNAGLFFDGDLGNPSDDFYGIDPSSNIVFQYNADQFDEIWRTQATPYPGYDSIIPAVGFKLINEQIEGSSFTPWPGLGLPSVMNRPMNPRNYIERFNRRWNNGNRFTRGDIGYDPNSTDYTNHLFTGDPTVPGSWAMNHLDPSYFISSGAELSSFHSFRRIELKPKQRKIYDLVFSTGYDSSIVNDNLGALALLKQNLTRAANFQRGVDSIAVDYTYSKCFVGEEEDFQYVPKDPLLVYPNPSNGTFTIESEVELSTLEVYSLHGQLVQQSRADNGSKRMLMQLPSSLPQGVYLLRAIDIEGQAYSKRIIVNP